MPRYSVTGTVVAGKFIGEFEADTAEEAAKLAWKSGDAYVSLCHQCSDQAENAEVEKLHVQNIDDDNDTFMCEG